MTGGAEYNEVHCYRDASVETPHELLQLNSAHAPLLLSGAGLGSGGGREGGGNSQQGGTGGRE